jgi:hypothetical protein
MGEPLLLINGRIYSFPCIIHCNFVSHVITICSRPRNKSYTQNYPSDDGEIVADDRSIPAAQAKVA